MSSLFDKIEKELTEEEKLLTFGLFGSQDSLLSHYEDFEKPMAKTGLLYTQGSTE